MDCRSKSWSLWVTTSVAVQPGFRNQFNTGLEQAIGKFLLIDLDYFWKYTHNAYHFRTLLNTTITFPIARHNSKLDGVTGRVSTTNLRGFQAYWTFGHNRARYFPPETGHVDLMDGLPYAPKYSNGTGTLKTASDRSLAWPLSR